MTWLNFPINRDIKRAKLADKFAAKRVELKSIIDDQSKTDEERYQARLAATAAAQCQPDAST